MGQKYINGIGWSFYSLGSLVDMLLGRVESARLPIGQTLKRYSSCNVLKICVASIGFRLWLHTQWPVLLSSKLQVTQTLH